MCADSDADPASAGGLLPPVLDPLRGFFRGRTGWARLGGAKSRGRLIRLGMILSGLGLPLVVPVRTGPFVE